MNRFKFNELSIKGIYEITHLPINDQRGYLSRLFCSNEMRNLGWGGAILQINKTFTKKCGSIRGMHFQLPPATESKIIICLKGEIFDVVVDIRKESKTFLKYISVMLKSDLNNMLLIPKGFAHGFQTLNDNVELLYLHDHEYNPNLERGINPLDPLINVKWPLKNSIISEKDSSSKVIDKLEFKGI